jgi:hypothetical protein
MPKYLGVENAKQMMSDNNNFLSFKKNKKLKNIKFSVQNILI